MTGIDTILEQQYRSLVKRFRVFGVFYTGRANYGLPAAEETDSIAVLIPSLRDLVFREPADTVIQLCDGRCRMMDIRLLIRGLKEHDLGCVEILFSRHIRVSGAYGHEYSRLADRREEIARMDEAAAVRRMRERMESIADEPSTEDLVEAFRIVSMIEKYIGGSSYGTVLDGSKYAGLREDALSRDKMRQTVSMLKKRAETVTSEYMSGSGQEPDAGAANAGLSAWMDEWLYDLFYGEIVYI